MGESLEIAQVSMKREDEYSGLVKTMRMSNQFVSCQNLSFKDDDKQNAHDYINMTSKTSTTINKKGDIYFF